MSTESRRRYEFSKQTRKVKKHEQKNLCAIPGCNCKADELHHILPVKVARDFYHDLAPCVVKAPENAIFLCQQCHIELHNEIARKSASDKRIYFNAIVQYLNEIYPRLL